MYIQISKEYQARLDCVDRQRFTVGHELGHLIMHIGFSVPENRETEKEANLFASEFLVPEIDLRKQILGYLTLPQVADLKRYWKVSMQAIMYKAAQCGIITPSNHKSLMIQIGKNGMKKQEPPELEPPKEKPVLSSTLLNMHLNDLDFSIVELSTTLGFLPEEANRKYFQIELKPTLRAIFR